MGRRAKQWSLREDYRPLLIETTKKLFPTVLAHINTKRIALVGIISRRCPFLARIYANSYPWSLLLPNYDYLIAFWSTRFDEKPHSEKVYIVFHELTHIMPEGQIEGHRSYRKLIKHDVEEFRFLLETYGIRLENVKDIMKGEKHLLDGKRKSKRFPREERLR